MNILRSLILLGAAYAHYKQLATTAVPGVMDDALLTVVSVTDRVSS